MSTDTALEKVAFTDVAIFESLPLEAQGELKEFGALEGKNHKELHDFLLHLREKYIIPPWHPLTLMFKRAAPPMTVKSGPVASEMYWCKRGMYNEDMFVPNAEIGNQTWCIIHISVSDKYGSTYKTDVVVDPKNDIVWSLKSEVRLISSVITVQGDGHGGHTTLKRRMLLRIAKAAIAKGNFEHLYEASSVGRRKARVVERMSQVSEVKPVVSALEQLKAMRAPKEQKPEDHPDVYPHRDKLTADMLLPMYELACAKARELGMDATVAMWKRKLEPLFTPYRG